MARRPDTVREIDRRINALCENFEYYLDVFEKDPFNCKMLRHHRATIRLRNELGSVSETISSNEFIKHLRDTLEAWGAGSRAGKLQPMRHFISVFGEYEDTFAELGELSIRQITNSSTYAWEIWDTIDGLKLSDTNSQIVAGSKALHHVLPRLMPPIDREYTRPFFCYHTNQFQYGQRAAFNFMFPYFVEISQRVNLSRYTASQFVSRKGWRWATSESKLIDNAIIGYCKDHKRRYPDCRLESCKFHSRTVSLMG